MADELGYGALLDLPPRKLRKPAFDPASFTFGSTLVFEPPQDIICSALVATPGLGQVVLTWAYVDPNINPSFKIATVEIWASKTNDRDLASNFGDALTPYTSFTHITAPQSGSFYYWIRARDLAGNVGPWFPTGSGVQGTANNIPNAPGLNYNLINGSVIATVAGNALTISVKTAAGSDPSPSDPVFVVFRNASLSSGTYTVRAITAALSLVIGSGNTLGTTNSTPFRLWVLAVDDAGTVRLAVTNCYNGVAIFALDEGLLINPVSETEVGAGNMDNAGAIYASQAISNAPFRAVANLEWTSGLATAGTWSGAPTAKNLISAGSHLPGGVVQEIALNDAATSSGTTVIPWDDTIPQIAEGDQIGVSIITPSSPINCIENEYMANVAASGADDIVMALFRAGASNAIASAWGYVSGADIPTQIRLVDARQAATSSSTSWTWRLGKATAGTLYVNSTSAGRKLGGTLIRFKRITERMV